MIPGVLPSSLVQIAYRVDDLDAACREWAAAVGAGPFLLRRHLPVEATHAGAPAVYDHSAAFGQWGPVMLELIEVHACEPAPLADLMTTPIGRLNHVACFVDDLPGTSAALEERGIPLEMALTSSSGMSVHFHDARDLIGGAIELYAPTDHLRAHYARVADLARDWDGSDPVRDMDGNPLP